MHALVLGHDGPGLVHEEHPLHERHQAYMDRWLPRLVARGPLLSPDEEHLGSVHVVEVDDLDRARRFATEEPFAAAGWYSEITVTTYLPLVAGTMWDRPRPSLGTRSSVVRMSWDARAYVEAWDRQVGGSWVFAGLLLDQEGRSIGLAGAVDEPEDEAIAAARRLDPGAHVTAYRWRRGGRDQGS